MCIRDSRYDSARYKTQLKKNGVKLMSATEIISEGPEGIILESVLEGYAEYYSADLAEKVVRGPVSYTHLQKSIRIIWDSAQALPRFSSRLAHCPR